MGNVNFKVRAYGSYSPWLANHGRVHLLHFLKFCIPHLYTGDNRSIYFTGPLREVDEVTHVEHSTSGCWHLTSLVTKDKDSTELSIRYAMSDHQLYIGKCCFNASLVSL
jgi:hypothetical protein